MPSPRYDGENGVGEQLTRTRRRFKPGIVRRGKRHLPHDWAPPGGVRRRATVLTRDPKAITPGGLVPPQWEELTEPVWQQLQAQLATLSTNSKHIVVDHASHNIQLEQPQVVVDAILDVIRQVEAIRAIK